MQTAFNIVLSVVFLFIAGWVIVFGGLGALLAFERDGAKLTGFLWGLCGPLGWLLILCTTRARDQGDVRDGSWRTPAQGLAVRATPGVAAEKAGTGEGKRL